VASVLQLATAHTPSRRLLGAAQRPDGPTSTRTKKRNSVRHADDRKRVGRGHVRNRPDPLCTGTSGGNPWFTRCVAGPFAVPTARGYVPPNPRLEGCEAQNREDTALAGFDAHLTKPADANQVAPGFARRREQVFRGT
jgi:hypothetical protein